VSECRRPDRGAYPGGASSDRALSISTMLNTTRPVAARPRREPPHPARAAVVTTVAQDRMERSHG